MWFLWNCSFWFWFFNTNLFILSSFLTKVSEVTGMFLRDFVKLKFARCSVLTYTVGFQGHWGCEILSCYFDCTFVFRSFWAGLQFWPQLVFYSYLNSTRAFRKSGEENDILMTFFTGLKTNELLHFNQGPNKQLLYFPCKDTIFLCSRSCLSVCIVEVQKSCFSLNVSWETMGFSKP